MCHSARCGCYFGGDCNDGPKSRSEIKEKIQKILSYLNWREMYISPYTRKEMEGKVAALEWSMYRTKKRVQEKLHSFVGQIDGTEPYVQGYFSGLRWVLGW